MNYIVHNKSKTVQIYLARTVSAKVKMLTTKDIRH